MSSFSPLSMTINHPPSPPTAPLSLLPPLVSLACQTSLSSSCFSASSLQDEGIQSEESSQLYLLLLIFFSFSPSPAFPVLRHPPIFFPALFPLSVLFSFSFSLSSSPLFPLLIPSSAHLSCERDRNLPTVVVWIPPGFDKSRPCL